MTHILVTNDDGVFSEGIRLLAQELRKIDGARVTVVAPDREQSASGHSLTLHRPLRIRKLAEGEYTVDGTPTDCVHLGVLSLLAGDPPDLVASGINFGTNMGDDVTYSGTVSATFEGTLLGIPSVAFSQEISDHFTFAPGARFARSFIETLLRRKLAPDLLLNVNFPAGSIGGVRFTRLGKRRYNQSVVEKVDPRGRKYYWVAGSPEWDKEEGTDQQALSQGLVSVTPLHLDLTDYRGLQAYEGLQSDLEALGTSEASSAEQAAGDSHGG